MNLYQFHNFSIINSKLFDPRVRCTYFACSVVAIRCSFLSAVFRLVPRHAVVRRHCQMVPGVTLVIKRRPDVDLSVVGVDGEDVGMVGLRRQTVTKLRIDAKVSICCFHLYPIYKINFHPRRRAVAWVRFYRRLCVCLSVCLFFHTISQKVAAARITKLDTENVPP